MRRISVYGLLVTCLAVVACSREEPADVDEDEASEDTTQPTEVDVPPDTGSDASDIGDDEEASSDSDAVTDVDSDAERPFTCWPQFEGLRFPDYDHYCEGVEGCSVNNPGVCQCTCGYCDFDRCVAVVCEESSDCDGFNQ